MTRHALEDLEKLWSPTGSGQGDAPVKVIQMSEGWVASADTGLHVDEESKATRHQLKQTKHNTTKILALERNVL